MLLLLLFTALGAQAAPTPASAPLSPAEAGAASQLARDWGVSIVEADARLARQKSIEDFIAAAQKRNPVTYGGAFIDQAGEGNLIVNETSPVSLTDLIAHFHLAGHVQERSARHSYASLVSLTGRVVALAKPQAAQLGAVTTFVDESRNAVRVRMMPTSPDPGTRAAFVSAIGGLGEDIVVTPDNQPMTLDAALCDFRSCPPPMRGGVEDDWTSDRGGGYVCTVGFVGHDRATGDDVAISAGHCHSEVGPYSSPDPAGSGLVVMGYENGYQNDGNVDAEEIDMSGTVYSPDLSNYVYQRNQPAYVSGSDSETYNEKFQITSVASNSQVVSGLYVCKSARSSGFTCGDIDEVNVSATACEQGTSICSNYTNFFGFAGCVAGGDSGGPIYDPSAHRAFGLVSYGPESTYFGCTSPSGQADGPMISNVLSTLGVTLNTTDQSVLF